MTANISQEMLKKALQDLVRNDHDFFLGLLSEALQHVAKPITPNLSKAGRRKTGKIKILPQKINPAYRKDTQQWATQFALSKSSLDELKMLFSDAPMAEQIIQSLHK